MIGKCFYKDNLNVDALNQAAEWCITHDAFMDDCETYYEVKRRIRPTQQEIEKARVNAKIAQLKEELSSTDYKCLKYVDGALTEEEYADVKAYRAELRRQINELEQ